MTQLQEKNFQISGGPYFPTDKVVSIIPPCRCIFDFFEKKEEKKYGYISRNGSTQNTKRTTDGTHRSIQKGTQEQDAGEFQRSCQCTHLDSPGLSPLLRWGDEQFGQARGLCLFPPTSCQTAHSYPHKYSDSQKYIFLLLRHDSLREDRWPGFKNMGHAAQSHSTEMQPSSFKAGIFHFLNYPHEKGCISLQKNIRTSNSEAIASVFPLIDNRHILEDMASFYHYFFSDLTYIFFLECKYGKGNTIFKNFFINMGLFSEKKLNFELYNNALIHISNIYHKYGKYFFEVRFAA